MAEKRFLTAADVSQIMECSISRAYTIIRQLNEEMMEKGYNFFERVYDGAGAVANV